MEKPRGDPFVTKVEGREEGKSGSEQELKKEGDKGTHREETEDGRKTEHESLKERRSAAQADRLTSGGRRGTSSSETRKEGCRSSYHLASIILITVTIYQAPPPCAKGIVYTISNLSKGYCNPHCMREGGRLRQLLTITELKSSRFRIRVRYA